MIPQPPSLLLPQPHHLRKWNCKLTQRSALDSVSHLASKQSESLSAQTQNSKPLPTTTLLHHSGPSSALPHVPTSPGASSAPTIVSSTQQQSQHNKVNVRPCYLDPAASLLTVLQVRPEGSLGTHQPGLLQHLYLLRCSQAAGDQNCSSSIPGLLFPLS